jgi:hypothetical protein
LKNSFFAMGVPDVGGTPHQVIVRHQAEQAGIGQIDGIVRSHPIIILAENIVHHRLAVYPKRIVLHRSITPLMMKDGITEQLTGDEDVLDMALLD